jgi:hypothetical protein
MIGSLLPMISTTQQSCRDHTRGESQRGGRYRLLLYELLDGAHSLLGFALDLGTGFVSFRGSSIDTGSGSRLQIGGPVRHTIHDIVHTLGRLCRSGCFGFHLYLLSSVETGGRPVGRAFTTGNAGFVPMHASTLSRQLASVQRCRTTTHDPADIADYDTCDPVRAAKRTPDDRATR